MKSREKSSRNKESQRFSYILPAPSSTATIPTMEEVLNGRLTKKEKIHKTEDPSETKHRVGKEKQKIKSLHSTTRHEWSETSRHIPPQPPKLPRLPTMEEILDVNRRVKVEEPEENYDSSSDSSPYTPYDFSQTLPLMEEVLDVKRSFTFEKIFNKNGHHAHNGGDIEQKIDRDTKLPYRDSVIQAKSDPQIPIPLPALSTLSTVRKVQVDNVDPPMSPTAFTFKMKVQDFDNQIPISSTTHKTKAENMDQPISNSHKAKTNITTAIAKGDNVSKSTVSKISTFSAPGNPNVKPCYSYSSLIGQALMQAPGRTLALAEIYRWISETYPFYKQDQDGNKRPRTNMSSNDSNELKIIDFDYARSSNSSQTVVDIDSSDSTIVDSDSGYCDCSV
ncbi:7311_t:CDS:2 [Racocetra fulgida]|uniref:7311_t:CDS:1 n=1 Tax=Racocetra fulgida TaxID=60492 RepID=A0A9N9FK46_9GLOM|nr:7311_t:CDS:2 [Racocetra fulgida]